MNDTLEMTPIMEAGLEEVTAAARHIEAEGIQHKVAITGDRNS